MRRSERTLYGVTISIPLSESIDLCRGGRSGVILLRYRGIAKHTSVIVILISAYSNLYVVMGFFGKYDLLKPIGGISILVIQTNIAVFLF